MTQETHCNNNGYLFVPILEEAPMLIIMGTEVNIQVPGTYRCVIRLSLYVVCLSDSNFANQEQSV